jgi:hypothetical protein
VTVVTGNFADLGFDGEGRSADIEVRKLPKLKRHGTSPQQFLKYGRPI